MAALNKIAPTSPSRQKPSELESSIANALYDLESNIPDMKSALRPLQFVSAREVRPDLLFLYQLLVVISSTGIFQRYVTLELWRVNPSQEKGGSQASYQKNSPYKFYPIDS